MRIRCNTVLISCVLFTIALIGFVPSQISRALALSPSGLATLHGDGRWLASEIGYNGIFSLNIILIGLIVVWTGYLKKIRWTWPIMFIIVFGWAFVGTILPMIRIERQILTSAPWSELSAEMVGQHRWVMEELSEAIKRAILFALMIIALFLPIKAFFWNKHTLAASHEHGE